MTEDHEEELQEYKIKVIEYEDDINLMKEEITELKL